MKKFCWVITLLSTFPAVFLVVDSFLGTNSAPQQGAEAAIACALVIIPYVFTRSVEGLSDDNRKLSDDMSNKETRFKE